MTRRKIARAQAEGMFGLLDNHVLLKIAEKLEYRSDRQAWCLVCKRFMALEVSSRKKLQVLRTEVLERVLRRYTELQELDVSPCLQVNDQTLEMVGELSGQKLQSINLARMAGFTVSGLCSLFNRCIKLTHLDLTHCVHIRDGEMIAIATLTRLESLKLAHCLHITDVGLICVAMGCRNLRVLSLRRCLKISDAGFSVVANHCQKLVNLDISYTEVTAEGLASITLLNHLKSLMLVEFNGVDDEGLAPLEECSGSLLKMDVAHCQNASDGGITEFATTRGPSTFQQLNHPYCSPMSGGFLATFEKLRNLQVIRLDGCKITNAALALMARACKSLRELSVIKCRGVTDGGIIAVLKECAELQHLNISCCSALTDLTLSRIATSCPHLVSLKMESCNLLTERGINLVGSRCLLLEEVDFTDCQVHDESLKSLARCTALKRLKLGYCLHVSDRGLEHISDGCQNLQELDLYRSPLVDDLAMAAIAKGCPRLRSINLSYCSQITDAGMDSLSQLRELYRLEMRSCLLVTSAGLSALAAGCKKLQELDLKRCYSIDDDGIIALARGCAYLRKITLSYCPISSAGVRAIASCSRMRILNLIHCKATIIDGLQDVLLNSGALKKVKISSPLRMKLPSLVTKIVEERGCRLKFLEKPEW